MEWIMRFVEKYQNSTAALAGAAGLVVAALVRYFSRRPIVRQAVNSSIIRTEREGYEGVIKQLREQNAYLEKARKDQDEYEALLLNKLHEERLKNLSVGKPHDPDGG